MKIQIKNYNSIEKLTYSLCDNKVNFLFGISGSGKSSIAKSLSSEPNEMNLKVGSSFADQEIKVNGKNPIYSDVALFNEKYIDNVLISKLETSDVYSIVFSNLDEVAKCRQDYLDSIQKLVLVKDEIYSNLQKIENLISVLGIAKNSDNSLNKKSKIYRYENNVQKIKEVSFCSSKTTKEIKWFSDGVKTLDFQNGKCPFCGDDLSTTKINKLLELSQFDAADFELIDKQTTTFSDLGIDLPNFKSSRQVIRFNLKVLELISLKEELFSIAKSISITEKNQLDSAKCLLMNPSKTLKTIFPNIYLAIKEAISDLTLIKKTLGNLKKETDRIIKTNVEQINTVLDRLGILYFFKCLSVDEGNKNLQFFICHKNGDDNVDMTDSLSSGEKNIIALIFFLISNKARKLLIIDDPVSSCDEYRRKSIFNFIFEFHDNATILVLSHDQVFAKFATMYRDSKIPKRNQSKFDLKIQNSIGKVDCITSYDGNAIFTCIHFNDFASLDYLIKRKIGSFVEIDYRLALNLRLLCELNKKGRKRKLIYEYLSAIVHKTDYDLIIKELNDKGLNETDIIKLINSLYQLRIKIPLRRDYENHININSFSDFEKILYLRFITKKNTAKKRMLYDELSNIVHLNESLAVCLNPYKFNYFSKYVYDKLVETGLK